MTRAIALILTLSLGCVAVADVAGIGLNLADAVKLSAANLRLKPEEARALGARKAVAVGLTAKEAQEIAGIGAVVADGSAEAIVEAYRSLTFLLRHPTVVAAGKFSTTPTLSDLNALTFDQHDLYALLKCRAGDCDVKLSAAEINKIRAVIGTAGALTAALRAKLSAEYKALLLARVKAYHAAGDAALDSYADKPDAMDAQAAFAALAREESEASERCPHLNAFLEKCAVGASPRDESFIYWAKQKFGDSKPVINLVQVLIHREGERTFVTSKQLYASHYTEAGLMVAELTPFADVQGRAQTLVVNTVRLRLDMLGGAFGFVKRRAAQPRLLDALRESLDWLRANLAKPDAVETQAVARKERP